MIRLLKSRMYDRSAPAQQLSLGCLEFDLMQILWSRGECNVRDVVQRLDRPVAYTTVMTTLDRCPTRIGLEGVDCESCIFVSV